MEVSDLAARPATLPLGKQPRHRRIGIFSGSQRLCESFGEKKDLFAILGVEPPSC